MKKYSIKSNELGITFTILAFVTTILIMIAGMIFNLFFGNNRNLQQNTLLSDIRWNNADRRQTESTDNTGESQENNKNTKNQDSELSVIDQNERADDRASNELALFENAGVVEYPNIGIISIIKNISGGKIKAIASDESIVNLSISDNKVITITPKKIKSEKNITIVVMSEPTEQYQENIAAFDLTIKPGTLDIIAEPYEGTYDGQEHGITLSCMQEGAKITYLNNGEYTEKAPTFKDAATYTVNYKVELEGYKTVSGSATATINKAANNLLLSANSGTISYPNNGNIKITKNVSGGRIVATSSDEKIANVSVNKDNEITIIPKAVDSTKRLTVAIKSEATENYTEREMIYDLTVEQGKLNVKSKSFEGVYDGKEHGIEVTCDQKNAKITYLNGTEYTDKLPKFKEAVKKTVEYKVELDGYKTVSGSETVVINKATNELILSEKSGRIVYPEIGTISVIKNVSGGKIVATSSDKDAVDVEVNDNLITLKPKAIPTEKNVKITITSEETENYGKREVTYDLKVGQGSLDVSVEPYKGTFDGKEHGITVSCAQEGAKVTYLNGNRYTDTAPTFKDASIYTINYKVSLPGYKTESGTLTVTIDRALNNLELSSTVGTIAYPTRGLISVKNNVSGGRIIVTSSDTDIADVRVENNRTITFIPKAVDSKKNVTITVKSQATKNFEEEVVTYDLTVEPGTLDITCEPYEGTYNGEKHGVIVSCKQKDAKITYLVDDKYVSKAPTFVNASTYTVYYKAELVGYKTVSASTTVTINKASNNLLLSENSGTITYPETRTIAVEKNISGGTITASISDDDVATVTVTNNNTITVTPKVIDETKNAIITVKSDTTENYLEKEIEYDLTVEQGTIDVRAYSYEGTYNGEEHSIDVSYEPSNARITYSTGGEYTQTKPTFVDVSTNTIDYKIELPGYKVATGSETVKINKSSNELILSSNVGTVVYPNPGVITVSRNASGGTITASISDESVATVNVSNNNIITITPKAIDSTKTATITVKSDATHNYFEKEIEFDLTVEQGTLDITSEPYEGTYDGREHGIVLSCLQQGARITYLNNGSYTTVEPKFTNASTYTVDYKIELAGYKTEAGTLTVVINKASNELVLSSDQGTIVYPNKEIVTVIKNISAGLIRAESSDENVATVAVTNNNTITITPKPISSTSTAKITVISETTQNYKENRVEYNLTVEQGTINVTATPAETSEVTYDGNPHGIVITSEPSNAKITYSTGGAYEESAPTFTNASTNNINYKVELPGYITKTGSLTVKINKAPNDFELSETIGTTDYPNTRTVNVLRNQSGGTVSATISDESVATVAVTNNNTITITPKAINTTKTAKITVKSAATDNYLEKEIEYSLSVKQGTLYVTVTPGETYEGTFDGNPHSITVTCAQEGAKITYLNNGSYTEQVPKFTHASINTIQYKVELAGYKTESGTLTVTINKATNDLALSASIGTIPYPGSGTVNVTRNVSGGVLSVTSSNTNIATAGISGNVVTITPKAVTSTQTVDITVKSDATQNYTEKTATYRATVRPLEYTIMFYGNGSTSGSTAKLSMKYNVAKNLTANGFIRDQYEFTGWNTKANGTGTSYSNSQSVNNLTTTDGDTINLYAQWKKLDWVFKENIKEPTCTEKGIDIYVLYGTETTKEVEIPALGHKQSSAWSYSSSGHYHSCERCGIQLTTTTAHTSSGNCTVCGYTGTFTVSYNLFKMTASNSTTTATYGSSYTTTLTPVNSLSYRRPDSISISMGGKTITSGYTYNYVSGAITINNITGNVVITASAVNYNENISFANAKEITLGKAETVELMQSYQLRVLAFTPTESGSYKFYSDDSVASTNATDPYAYLYSSNQGISIDDLDQYALNYSQTGSTSELKNALASNDDGGNGYNFSITYNCTAGVTYYLAIRTYTPSKVQSFNNVYVVKN